MADTSERYHTPTRASVVWDARGLSLGHATRGVGRVVREVLRALDAHAPGGGHVVMGEPADLAFLRTLPIYATNARALHGVLSPGRPPPGARVIVRLTPTAAGADDARSVVVLYDLMQLEQRAQHHPWHRRLRAPLAWPAYLSSVENVKRARLVVTISRAVADDAARLLALPRAQLRPVPLAASDSYAPPATSTAVARDEVVWVLGGLNPNKNLDTVLRTWAQPAPQPLPPLVIVGGLPPRVVWRIRAQAQVRGAPSPTFAGRIDDAALALRMANARCVIVPSLAEGYGLPVAEARAVGARVLASDIPALRELADDDAAGITLVSPRDSRAWRDAILSATPAPAPAARRRFTDVARELLAVVDEA